MESRSIDLWRAVDGKTVEGGVMVDFPHVMARLSVEAFGGYGWEAGPRGGRMPSRSAAT